METYCVNCKENTASGAFTKHRKRIQKFRETNLEMN